jgi:hypothetical protein
MVGIHGGTCTAHNFDVDAKHTASLSSSAFGIPFVAFNRPSYQDSSPILPLPEDTTYLQEEGKWNHEYIFPALWDTFGAPNDCTGIVTLSHSMAVPGTIIAAANYAKDPSPKYPLAGIILSGHGNPPRWRNREELAPALGSPPPPDKIRFPYELKRDLMLSEPDLRTHDAVVLQQLSVQDTFVLKEEIYDLTVLWVAYWRQYSDEIRVPILYALGQYDWLWDGTREHVEEFASCFPNSARVDAGLVAGAPHALEWWWGSQAWYARCFGWGAEVATSLAVKQKQGKNVKEVYDKAAASGPAAWLQTIQST